ncbi:MAG: AtpZ/AtpI family protein [Lachnospiraceae bacterium]|nr:AtpZ/AtpI family protein [Lachnospiraceae bacterium]
MKRKGLAKTILLISQIAFSMLAPIGLGGVIGYFLDRWLGTSFLILVFLLMGIAAGYRSVWQLVKGYTKDAPQDTEPRRTEKRSPAEEEFERWKREKDRKGHDA